VFALVVAAALAAGLVAAGVSVTQPEEYEAQTRLILEPQDESRVLDPYAPLPPDDSTVDSPGRRLWTHAEQIQSDRVAGAVRTALHIDASTREILEHVSVSPVGLGYAIQITATGTTPDQAISLANGFADAYISYLAEQNADAKAAAAETITEGLQSPGDDADVDRLAVRAEELLIEASLPLSSIRVVNEAVEATHTSPKVLRDAGLAAVLAAFLAGGAAIVSGQGRRGRAGTLPARGSGDG
jgi:uncharacterized protein involved in exopolysaccharide biosynthesis